MTITRHRFRCRTKGCPWKESEEMHRNWCGHQGRPSTHLHHPKKGMGGNNPKSKIVAIACWPCHNSIDNNMGAIHEKDFPDGSRRRWGTDLHGKILFERVLEGSHPVAESDNRIAREPPQAAVSATELDSPGEAT